MSQVYNWLWLHPVPAEPRTLAAAREVKNTVVVWRPVPAVILYPCLMTPCVYREDAEDPWIELLIASKGALKAEHVNLQLKISASLAAEKTYHREALFAGTFGNIEVEEAKPDGEGVVRTHEKFSGALHELFRKRLDKAGFKQLFRVRVHYQALVNAKNATQRLRPQGQTREEYQHWRAQEGDRLIKAMLEERHVHGEYRQIPGKGTFAFNLNAERGVQLWDEGAVRAVDWNEPIQAYHPVYFYAQGEGPERFGFGHLSDIHLNGRLDILQRNSAQVIQEATDESPPLSKLIEPTNRSFDRLLSTMAGDRDVGALLIGGDLIDHQLNAYTPKPPTDMLDVWDAVDLGKQEHRYAPGVDMVSFYTLLLKQFCRKAPKPVFGVAGNHDCYLAPFGISPRVLDTVRANEGIPADVNLTFYEAALAFGPSWQDCDEPLRLPGSPTSSFHKEWMEWFYTVLTPFTDFSVQLPKQQLVCLGWGDNEDMFLGGQGVGHLPRADEPITASQLELVRAAVRGHRRRSVVVLSHFTVASFREEIPLVGVDGKPARGSLEEQESEYNMGTFESKRREFIELLGQRTISCVLTGHSHRRGLYLLGNPLDQDKDGRPELGTRTVTMYDPERLDLARLPEQRRMPAIVVSDSGGPYPRYNRAGEFGGWGSDKPSGSVVKFDEDGRVARVKVVTGPRQNLPRLAVALDYVDVLKLGVWAEGSLQTEFFDLRDERRALQDLAGDREFYRLNTRLHADLEGTGLRVRSMTFYALGTRLTPFTVDVAGRAVCVFRGTQNRQFFDWVRRAAAPDRFLAVMFDWADDQHRRFERYSMDHAWTFEVTPSSEPIDKYAPNTLCRYRLARPERWAGGVGTFPEVPNFAWRRKHHKRVPAEGTKAAAQGAPSAEAPASLVQR
jgi:Calcineurin-like phosphoesterase